VIWQIHRVKFEQPIQHELVLAIDLLDPDVKAARLLQDLYLISREATAGGDMDKYWQRQQCTNRYVIGQVLLTEPVLTAIAKASDISRRTPR